MKTKLSVTVEKGLLDEAEIVLKEGSFRNKSHLIEYALKKFLRDGK